MEKSKAGMTLIRAIPAADYAINVSANETQQGTVSNRVLGYPTFDTQPNPTILIVNFLLMPAGSNSSRRVYLCPCVQESTRTRCSTKFRIGVRQCVFVF
jgi:hypothetical protein